MAGRDMLLGDEYLRRLGLSPPVDLARPLLQRFTQLGRLELEDLGLPGVGLALIVQLAAL